MCSEPESIQYSFAAGVFYSCDDESIPASQAELAMYTDVEVDISVCVDLETGLRVEADDIDCYAVDVKPHKSAV